MHRALSILTLAGLLAAPASAQVKPASTSPLVRSIQGCQGLQDDAARLACFDKAAAALVGAATTGEVAIVDREQVRTVRRSLFGFSLPDFPFFKGGDDKKEEEPKELITTLAAFNSIGNNRYRFMIADGNAVWETTESADIYDPDRGDKVTIKRGMLSSYFVQIEGQPWVRARRIR